MRMPIFEVVTGRASPRLRWRDAWRLRGRCCDEVISGWWRPELDVQRLRERLRPDWQAEADAAWNLRWERIEYGEAPDVAGEPLPAPAVEAIGKGIFGASRSALMSLLEDSRAEAYCGPDGMARVHLRSDHGRDKEQAGAEALEVLDALLAGLAALSDDPRLPGARAQGVLEYRVGPHPPRVVGIECSFGAEGLWSVRRHDRPVTPSPEFEWRWEDASQRLLERHANHPLHSMWMTRCMTTGGVLRPPADAPRHLIRAWRRDGRLVDEPTPMIRPAQLARLLKETMPFKVLHVRWDEEPSGVYPSAPAEKRLNEDEMHELAGWSPLYRLALYDLLIPGTGMKLAQDERGHLRARLSTVDGLAFSLPDAPAHARPVEEDGITSLPSPLWVLQDTPGVAARVLDRLLATLAACSNEPQQLAGRRVVGRVEAGLSEQTAIVRIACSFGADGEWSVRQLPEDITSQSDDRDAPDSLDAEPFLSNNASR